MAVNIRSVFFPSGTGQFIELKLDLQKYDSALLTACGGSTTAPTSGQTYPYRSVKAALKTGAIARATVTVKEPTTKKVRRISVVCDKDKVATLKNALLPQKVKVGGTIKTDWDVTDVVFA